MTYQLLDGDCLETLAGMEDCSIDAVVTDPPYGISFMGKEWDGPGGMLGQMATGDEQRGVFAYGGTHSRGYADNDNVQFQEWCRLWASELLRVLKPGGHLLAFGGTRTYHRLACGVEDAGFEIRDCLAWMYGSGFPKSLDVSKAIDKAAGAEREVVGTKTRPDGSQRLNAGNWQAGMGYHGNGPTAEVATAPATPAAQKWQGWGTALKPAYEPVILARKPLTGTVAANVQEFGTGALNIDACRVAGPPSAGGSHSGRDGTREVVGNYGYDRTKIDRSMAQGRWPANLILDPEAGAMLDAQSGETTSGAAGVKGSSGFTAGYDGDYTVPYGDTGGASRFFYCAKASRAERNAGLDGLPKKRGGIKNDSGRGFSESDPYAEILVANHHPTVKPIDLMRYLVRLVTPPGGTVLDPFTGSGTTGIAANLEGFDFIGIEREAEYREIAEARLNWWGDQDGETDEILRRAGLAEKKEREAKESGQASLFDEEAA